MDQKTKTQIKPANQPINNSRPAFRSFALEVTSRCNQQCTYCYNAWRGHKNNGREELDTARFKGLIDKILEQVKLSYFTLTGGEPFMRNDLFEIIEHINSKGLGVVIISNGGMINAEKAKVLAGLKILYIQVTLAGPDESLHDKLCGSGAFARAIRAIQELSLVKITVGGSYLVTKTNFHAAEAIMDCFADLNIKRVAFNRFNPSGYSADAVDELLPTRSHIIEALRGVNLRAGLHKMIVSSTMPIPHCVLDRKEYPNIKFGSCSAGTPLSEIAISQDGRVRLCTLQRDSLGNLFELPLAQILDGLKDCDFRKQIPSFCVPCPLAKTCLGGCGAAAQWVSGSADRLDPFISQHIDHD